MNGSFNEHELITFVIESNKIEGITRPPTDVEVFEHEKLWKDRTRLSVERIEQFVWAVARESLRDKPGMQVYIGNHTPPPGGPDIAVHLDRILHHTAHNTATPCNLHQGYETLHPFMDGNGRSGRAIWAWQMMKHNTWPGIKLGFLHAYYYQSLAESQTR